jgi:hypothetical protein
MDVFRFILHYGLHFIAPFIIAFVLFRKHFWKASIIILLANLIDLDHLIANPIFDPERCSIGFHLLHSYVAICIYFVLIFFSKTRLLSIGLMLHILADIIDCLWI